MSEIKPEDVVRVLENGRYIDADKLWNNRPKMPNANAYGTYHDGFFDCMSKFSAIIRKAIDEECVSAAALALLREKDAHINMLAEDRIGWADEAVKAQMKANEKDAEIERLQSMNQTKLDMIHDLRADLETARAEAITEFLERICQEIEQTPNANEFFINAWKTKFEEIAKELKEELK